MIENVLFGQITMGGEMLRIALALLGAFVGTYFDIWNKRKVPDRFLYAFLAIALLVNIIFFDSDLLLYTAVVVAPLLLFGYLFYMLGYVGGADIVMIASLALLLPIPPSVLGMSVNYPFILLVLLFAFTGAAIYLAAYFGIRLAKAKEAKADVRYLLLLLPYAFAVWLLLQLQLFPPLFFFIFSITLLLCVFFLTYRNAINRMMVERLPLKRLEQEDVLALEFMDKETVWRYRLQRLVTADELKRLRKLKLKEIWVYTKLPPFLPFIAIGLLLALLLGNQIVF